MTGTRENTPLEVAGRRFWPVTPGTMEHLQFIHAQFVGSQVVSNDITEIAACVLEAGRASKLLAGFYVEEGLEGPRMWNRKMALKVAECFAASPESVDAQEEALAQGLLRFFGVAPGSTESSPDSSEGTPGPASDDPASEPGASGASLSSS